MRGKFKYARDKKHYLCTYVNSMQQTFSVYVICKVKTLKLTKYVAIQLYKYQFLQKHLQILIKLKIVFM